MKGFILTIFTILSLGAFAQNTSKTTYNAKGFDANTFITLKSIKVTDFQTSAESVFTSDTKLMTSGGVNKLVLSKLATTRISGQDAKVIFKETSGLPYDQVDISPSVNTYTANRTANADDRFILMDATGGNRTVNLPTAASSNKVIYTIKKIDNSANTVTIDGSGTETIDAATTKILTTQNQVVTIVSNGTAWYITSN